MSYEGATFSQHSVLSPPLLAVIDSQHTFGSYDHSSSSQVTPNVSSSQPPTSSHQRTTRSRASSAASVHNIVADSNTAISSLQQNATTSNHRRSRRGPLTQSGHSRSGSRSGPMLNPARSVISNVHESSRTTADELRPLTTTMRNRSTPHLDTLRSLSSANEPSHPSGSLSAFTAPSSPLLSTAATMAMAMSPVAQATALADHLMPAEWALDSFSVPTSPHATSISRNASDYFDPALLAQLQSQNNSSHPELRSRHGDPCPPIDTNFGRLAPHSSHVARSASQSESERAQHAAHAHLLGLQRLFASRSTPHLPDLDSTYLIGHEFESPPPYAPRASATETELERAVDLASPRFPPSASSASTLNNASTTSQRDPPLPPPISIPTAANGLAVSDPPLAVIRPGLRARSSSRGSRSGPPSPSASFYGRRGLTSLSPFPAGLEMTPSVIHVSQFASTPASPGGFAPDSDGVDDLQGAVSFSTNSGSKAKRGMVAALDSSSRVDVESRPISANLPGSSGQAQAMLARRRRSASAGSARQLLRPRTPINPSVASATLPQHSAEGSANASPFKSDTTPVNALNGGSRYHPEYAAPTPLRASPSQGFHQTNSGEVSPPESPTSDSTHPSAPKSPSTLSPSTPSSRIANIPAARSADDASSSKPAKVVEEDEEEFPVVLKLLLHPLRILAAVPGCIGTFWLARNAFVLFTRHGQLLSPGSLLISANGTTSFVSTSHSEPSFYLESSRLGRRQPGSLDFFVACLWSMSTAYHALSFTTLLLRRWLLYYSILPSLIRLVALQAICWPLVRITVHVFGADQPLGAWVVIGTTTALSDVVSRWVTSNIADAPLDDESDDEEECSDEATVALGYLSDSRFVKSPTRSILARRTGLLHTDASSGGAGVLTGIESDWDPRSGDESDAAAASFYAGERERQRKQRRGGQGTRFWRAVIGGPSFANSRRKKSKTTPGVAGTETEMEGDSDWPGYATDRTVLGGTGTDPNSRPTFNSFPIANGGGDGLRRRLGPGGFSIPAPAAASRIPREARARRTVLQSFPFQPSTYWQGHARFFLRDGVWLRERTSSKRNFHWEVAVWRNVVPIAVLAYLSMWVLIADAMRLAG
ncbi:related to Myp1 protein [Melanopsichium pennsylvanicum]|uniref:Related to Myp1 protein n=2 Tax=Melanopsichium pennsylvanicum TaxID=63383 RepID=A0AAJ4XJY1_9BASI|nr:Myp1 protein [Melanopsichium pennsylvanicum 4]SNX83707.1 related to Myp1 protein [Melanopsichium pennsylvanicum]